jgi:hypothetical protein
MKLVTVKLVVMLYKVILKKQLNPNEYRKMAKTDSDFDAIRENERFQALIQ